MRIRDLRMPANRIDPVVSWVVPVLNEEAQLRANVIRLAGALEGFLCRKGAWEIVIADNGSTDRTAAFSEDLVRCMSAVRYLRLEARGRGRALKHAWLLSQGEILAYSDVDLSTDLRHVPELLGLIMEGGFDLAMGSRLAPGAETRRGWKREILSRGYSMLTRAGLRSGFLDLQCGFKAIRREAAIALLPMVESNCWFFDTELVILAERSGYRVREFPIRWIDDPDSRVRIAATVIEDICGILRLRRQLRRKVEYLRSMQEKLHCDLP